MEDTILQGLAYALPALITGGVAYMILSKFIDQDKNEKKFEALVAKKKESLPIKLQAYERLLLFCERINPPKLLLRVNAIDDNATAYLHLLLGNIEQEFEHNMVQQLYVSDDVWKAVVGSKLAIVNIFSDIAEKSTSAKEFHKNLLTYFSQTESPTEMAAGIIKQEVKKLL